MNNLSFALIGMTLLLMPAAASGAQGTDPDWPCIQRKIPELSIAQVWRGGTLPPSADNWSGDTRIATLVTELASRRNPVENARKQLEEYATSLPKADRKEKLAQVFQGLFDKLNGERQQVIAGIARYANRQREMATDLRKESAAVDRLQADAGTDPAELDARRKKLEWEIRVFQERVQSLSFVCEVPTLIEQRLYSLSNILSELAERD